MRKVWAMSIALMIAAIILTPALGYTLQSAGNQSYTASSGARVNYTVGSGTAAHNLTMEMILTKMNIPGPAVTGTRSPYSFKPGPAVPYSMKLPGVTGVREGYQTKKAPAVVGKTYTETVAQPAAPETVAPAVTPEIGTPVEAPVNETPVVPAEQPKFTIEGIVYDDAEGNGLMDNNETGMANRTVNLEQPAGTVINTATTDANGKFAFADLAAGEYIVSQILQMGWNLIAPADGKIPVVITNESMTTLQFANQMAPPAPAVVPMNETANATAPA
ncbi:MAG: SpaA isopeptide-forming pilin-related protein [Methanothrix sp.]|nr:SpaA isopeptide-forming pilin-related protein [Methanothrix sp.]